MTGAFPNPGEWPDVTEGTYERLVKLARLRLVGFERHAEDVVANAFIKWRGIPPEKASTARIEQVVKTEAMSLLRSERRLRQREQAVTTDRSSEHSAWTRSLNEMQELRHALVDTCTKNNIELTRFEVEFLDLTMAGFDHYAIVRHTGVTRYEVRKARDKWRRVIKQMSEEGYP